MIKNINKLNKLLKLDILKPLQYGKLHYEQGQSPEAKIREYFYFIDHHGMVCTTLLKYVFIKINLILMIDL